MPEALATTKRKFHKLLDSRFGSPQGPRPTTTNPRDSQATLAEPAAKRIRSGASTASLSASLHGRNTSNISLHSVRTVASSRTVNAPPQPTREPPNFSPWSHDTFVARLRTFSRVTLWHPKPEAVNEVEWAKRGWSCVDTNTVCCKGGCHQRLLVDVEPVVRRRHVQEEKKEATGDEQEEMEGGATSEDEEANDEEFEKALAERYRHLIIDGHAESCLWRQAGCKNDIYRLPIVKSTVWQPGLREKYASLMKISASIQHIKFKPDDLKPSPEKLLADFPTTLLAPEDASNDKENDASTDNVDQTPETRHKALVISICGWRGMTDSGTELLCCDACFQRIGLWMYQPDYKQSHFSEDDEDQDHSLDLIEVHREHCPWRNPTSQSASGDYAGWPAWKILHDVLSRYADENRRRSMGRGGTPRAVSEVEGGVAEDEEGIDGLELMPELTREETERLDKERTSRLKRLKSVFRFK
ncbi:C3HC zinc finger-like-domain-containing protein, partial [Delphinella strobiligena]